MSLDEFTVALHRSIAQVRTHFASYKFAEYKREEALASSTSKTSDAGAVAAAFTAVPPEEADPFNSDALFMRALMSRAPCNTWFTTADARLWLKNKRRSSFKNDLNDKIDAAVNHQKLENNQLKGPADASKKKGTTTGRSGQLARKRCFQEVQDNEKKQRLSRKGSD